MPKCERSDKECSILYVAPDSPPDRQIAVSKEEYEKAFRKHHPDAPMPEGFNEPAHALSDKKVTD